MPGAAGNWLVSRRFAAATALGTAVALATVAVAAFYVPHARLRRDYEPATCTEQAAEPACLRECRVANVSAPEFPDGVTGVVARGGLGQAPCDGVAECGGKVFRCRFRVLEGEGQVRLSVREEVGEVSLGFVVFMGMSGGVLVLLGLWLVADCVRGRGLLSRQKLRAVVFLPPGIELVGVTRAARRRWPNLDTRGLDFSSSVVDERPEQFHVTLRRVLGHECKPEKRGVIFVVKANGKTDEAVLDAMPQSWYRLAVLPPLDVLMTQFPGESGGTHPHPQQQPQSPAPPAVFVSSAPGHRVSAEHKPELRRDPAPVGTWFLQRNRVLEAQAAHCELSRLCTADAGLFDYVHSAIRAEDLTNYPQLVRAVCGPVIGLRSGTLAMFIRVQRKLHSMGSSLLQLFMCVRDDKSSVDEEESSEDSFEDTSLPSSGAPWVPHTP